MTEDASTLYDVIIIGGGVVGLAVLRAATLNGWKCALVEAESELLTQASGSNSGIVCTGVDASPGTLERALIRDSIAQFRGYCRAHNISSRPCGSLVCLWPWDDNDVLKKVLQESHDAGDTHANHWTPEKVRTSEPNLSDSCQGAIHIPGEIVVDPWLYSISLCVHARENGAIILTNFCVDGTTSSFQNEIWTIRRKQNGPSTVPVELKGKCVVNAAGIFADVVQSQSHGISRWTARPRRGQYQIYKASPASIITHPIQPVPSQYSKGIFVFSTLYNHLVVGPTALDQTSRTDRQPDPKVAEYLDSIIQRILPGLDPKMAYVGDYVGIRPGTDQRDYQISSLSSQHWVAVAGIRSTGLTASLGIGNYTVRLLENILEAPLNVKPIQTTPMPPLSELVRDFHRRNDGSVLIQDHAYQVTHPLTRLGWKSQGDTISLTAKL